MKIVATTSLPAVDRPNADRWNAARSRQEEDFLDTHSFTCEMFKCHNCQSTFNMLQDIKTHMSKEHN